MSEREQIERLERQVKVLSTLAVVSNDSPIQGAELEIQLHAAAHHDVAQGPDIQERGPVERWEALRDAGYPVRAFTDHWFGK